jgi:hypothetical protein
LADVGKDGRMILKFMLKKVDRIEIEWSGVVRIHVGQGGSSGNAY